MKSDIMQFMANLFVEFLEWKTLGFGVILSEIKILTILFVLKNLVNAKAINYSSKVNIEFFLFSFSCHFFLLNFQV